MNKFVSTVIAFIVVVSVSGLRASDPVKIKLDKNSYLVGEPIWVELKFLPEDTASGVENFWHNWNINYKLEAAERYFGMAVWSDIEEKGKDVIGPLPNEGVEITESFSIDTKNYYPEMSAADAAEAQPKVVFDKPGRYVFLANYKISAPSVDSDNLVIVKSEYASNLVFIEVLQPEGRDKEAWALLSEFPASIYYASGGLVSDPELEDRAKETVVKLFSDYPDTIYAKRYSRFLKENSKERWNDISRALPERNQNDESAELVGFSLSNDGNEAKAEKNASSLAEDLTEENETDSSERRDQRWIYLTVILAVFASAIFWFVKSHTR